MATQDIKVTTGELRNISNTLTTLAGDYKDDYDAVLSRIGNMVDKWKEIDSETYRNKVQSFKSDFERMKKEIDDYALYLKNSAQAYEDTQQDAVNRARNLVGGK